jgi:CxxC-x17-CxxC domain-containing protein
LISRIVSFEARKYRLNLIMAHQYVGQLITDTSTKVRDAVFGNVGTMIVFRVGAADAEALEKEFEPEFMIQDIVNLPNYRIYLKLMVDGVSARPFSALTLPPFNVKSSPDAVKTIIDNSRRLYARSKEEVEGEINRWSGMMGDSGGEMMAPSGTAVKRFKATCSNCGKPTTVPFEPTPGRPLYCEDCFLKVKGTEPDYKKKSDRYVPHLANLGIEFSERKGEKPSGETPERRTQPQSQPRSSGPTERSMPQYTERKPTTPPRQGASLESTLASREAHAPKEAPSSMSLSSLKSDAKQPRQKQAGKEIDIAELRREITEALHRASSGE